jgi:hypothetical protein
MGLPLKLALTLALALVLLLMLEAPLSNNASAFLLASSDIVTTPPLAVANREALATGGSCGGSAVGPVPSDVDV